MSLFFPPTHYDRKKRSARNRRDLDPFRPSYLPLDRPFGPKKKSKLNARSRGQQAEDFIRWMKEGLTATQALAKIGQSETWLWRLRRRSSIFNERVIILDRIAKDIPASGRRRRRQNSPTARGALKVKTTGLNEEGMYTRRQRLRAEADLVDLRQKEAFLAIYRESGSRIEALDKLHLKAREVEEELAADGTFAARFSEEQLRKLWTVEDNVMERAQTSGVEARYLLNRKAAVLKPPAPAGPRKQAPAWADEKKLRDVEDWAKGEVGFGGRDPEQGEPS